MKRATRSFLSQLKLSHLVNTISPTTLTLLFIVPNLFFYEIYLPSVSHTNTISSGSTGRCTHTPTRGAIFFAYRGLSYFKVYYKVTYFRPNQFIWCITFIVLRLNTCLPNNRRWTVHVVYLICNMDISALLCTTRPWQMSLVFGV